MSDGLAVRKHGLLWLGLELSCLVRMSVRVMFSTFLRKQISFCDLLFDVALALSDSGVLRMTF